MDRRGKGSLGPYPLRVQSGQLFLPNEIASKIENMVPQAEGTLRSVIGPAALFDLRAEKTEHEEYPERPPSLPDPSVGDQVIEVDVYDGREYENGNPNPTTEKQSHFNYGENQHGIYHALLKNGERDVLVLHTGDEIWEFAGWRAYDSYPWRRLLGPEIDDDKTGLVANLVDDTRPRFPTQFATTSNGIIIVPQEGRAYFYDGVQIMPLGFSERPGAPSGRGPRSSKARSTNRGRGVNDQAYTHDSTEYETAAGGKYKAGMTHGAGKARIGTLAELTFDASVFASSADTTNALQAGWIRRGMWRARTQFIDQYGNLSAPSRPSSEVGIDFQPSVIPDPSEDGLVFHVRVDSLLKQLAWAGIVSGPDHCVGRILHRTKDLINSGDESYYELPLDTTGVTTAFATLPDNVSQLYPDNIPDAFLVRKAQEVDPVPPFKLCAIAFSRLWVANTPDSPGMLRPSEPGFWGTFPSDKEIYPDATGAEITGLHRADRGLLVFTRRSTFLVQASDDGARFRSAPVSADVGCVAPSSIQTLADGRVIWLGVGGFYTFDGNQISIGSPTLGKEFRRVTRARERQAVAAFDARTNEYRCWVSVDGSVRNNFCFIYDGQGWRTRTDVVADAVCMTQDHRDYMLIAGNVADDVGFRGPFVLDHSGNRRDLTLNTLIDARTSMIETSWLNANTSQEKKTMYVLYVWLRETADAEITVEVMRDWRENVLETVPLKRYPSDDPPNFWGDTKWDQDDAVFVERRPYWTRAQVYVPSSEVVKFRIKGTGLWEFTGIQVELAPRGYGGAQTPP